MSVNMKTVQLPHPTTSQRPDFDLEGEKNDRSLEKEKGQGQRKNSPDKTGAGS